MCSQLVAVLVVAIFGQMAMGYCGYQNVPLYHGDGAKVFHPSPYYPHGPYGYGAAHIIKAGPAGVVAKDVYEKVVAAPSHEYPLHVPRGIYAPHFPSQKIVNVEVDVQKKPGYPFLPSVGYPKDVTLDEKIRLPSVAVKEREAVVLGAEHQRTHQFVNGHPNTIVKKIGWGC